MGTLDRWLAVAYRRFGWRRLLLGYVAWGWLCGAVGVALCFLVVARLERAGATDLAAGAVMFGSAFVVGSTLGVVGSARQIADLAVLDAPSDRSDLEQAWTVLLGVPASLTRWNCGVMVVLCIPPFLALPLLPGFDASTFAVVTFLVPAGVLVATVAGFGGLQVAIRPIARHLLLVFPRPPVVPGGGSIRAKLTIGVPGLVLTMAITGALLGIEVGTSAGVIVGRVVIATGVAVVMGLPVVAILVASMLQPLGDLVRAAHRLEEGEYDTVIPAASTDEYGRLAHSFNASMQGLAERQRLAAENEELLREVRASRARIITASDAERRRIERNIHDGAQQRLVALTLDLRALELRADAEGVPELRTMAGRAAEDLRHALEEVRDLARGLHPSVLETDGLRPAIEQLAHRAKLPVTIEVAGGRFGATAESTAYFVAAEALTNTAKHAGARRAAVRVAIDGADLVVEVVDDGVGGARAAAGSGLAGLADRVAALDGSLSIVSEPGEGTSVSARLPLEGRS